MFCLLILHEFEFSCGVPSIAAFWKGYRSTDEAEPLANGTVLRTVGVSRYP